MKLAVQPNYQECYFTRLLDIIFCILTCNYMHDVAMLYKFLFCLQGQLEVTIAQGIREGEE